jgi:hypothetical protein
VKRGGSLSFLVGAISNVLVMEIGWTDGQMWGAGVYLSGTMRIGLVQKWTLSSSHCKLTCSRHDIDEKLPNWH